MKIGIVGVGGVGATTAFLLASVNLAKEIVLVNRTMERAIAEAADITHALPIYGQCDVRSGNFSDLKDFDIIVISCGAKRGKVGINRLDLLRQNIQLFLSAVEQILKAAPSALIIVVTNPVDVLAGIAADFFGIPGNKIISTGTILDSARFEVVLSEYFQIVRKYIKADVLGEHGDNQVPIWSSVRIFDKTVDEFCKINKIEFSDEMKKKLSEQTRLAADKIIAVKQSTYYGIAGSVVKICQALQTSAPMVLNISSLHKNFGNIGDVFISTPTTICSGKIEIDMPLAISDTEMKSLIYSAEVINKHTREGIAIARSGNIRDIHQS